MLYVVVGFYNPFSGGTEHCSRVFKNDENGGGHDDFG